MIMKSLNHCHFTEKKQKYHDYIQGLEQELGKIQVFQRELPLCLELVTQAIENCKQQLSGTTSSEINLNEVLSECSEQTSRDVPVLEEFIPTKRAFSSHDSDGEEQEIKKPKNDTDLSSFKAGNVICNEKNSKKSDWLSSVQLWSQTPDQPSKVDSPLNRTGSGGAFHPFKKEKSANTAAPLVKESVDRSAAPASTSSATTGGSKDGSGDYKKEEKVERSERKTRRSWSPELHRRFVQALQQLGGSHVATPKQIREYMKVDGLTNDEVKSHLQKFRLHTRRPSQSVHNNSNNNNAQTPQFVVVGGIFLSPEYAAMAATATGEASVSNTNGIYAPIATLPPPFRDASASPKQKQHKLLNSDERGSHSEGRAQLHSPTSSSSMHTTTASPA